VNPGPTELSSARSGAFETLRVYRGTPFAWRRHLERLTDAAGELGITAPDPVLVRRAVDEVLRADALVDARVRITVLAPHDGTAGGHDNEPSDVIVGAGALSPQSKVARVVIALWPRNDRAAMAGVKSTSYAENVRAFADAGGQGADECVFANTRGELCEATGSNVFVVDRGVIRTPPVSSGCLPGVTRSLVIELARAAGIPVEETAMPIGGLATAAEAFLTSTTREVLAIGEVDGNPLPSAPGPITQRLASLYTALVDRDPDP
jgi:branched-chain amino acid aminotransferase